MDGEQWSGAIGFSVTRIFLPLRKECGSGLQTSVSGEPCVQNTHDVQQILEEPVQRVIE